MQIPIRSGSSSFLSRLSGRNVGTICATYGRLPDDYNVSQMSSIKMSTRPSKHLMVVVMIIVLMVSMLMSIVVMHVMVTVSHTAGQEKNSQ